MALIQVASNSRFPSLRYRSLIWLVFALLMIVATILLWMFSKTSEIIEDKKVSKIPVVTTSGLNVNKKLDTVADLGYKVAPIEFETIVRDMRNYPDEFVDQNFLTKNTDKWTVQVMDVGEHDIIIDYLEQRKEDRNKFAYFRYTNSNNQLRYVLTYGLVNQFDDAMLLMQETDFHLPKTVKVAPEEVNRFISVIDNYERSEAVLDMSTNRPRSIILKPTRREVPVRRARPKSVSSNNLRSSTPKKSNSTTSTRKKNTSKSMTANNDEKKPSIRHSKKSSDTLNVKESRQPVKPNKNQEVSKKKINNQKKAQQVNKKTQSQNIEKKVIEKKSVAQNVKNKSNASQKQTVPKNPIKKPINKTKEEPKLKPFVPNSPPS